MSEAPQESKRVGDRYEVAESAVREYHENGYIALPDVITESELAEIEEIYERFMRNEFDGMGRDFCDMSGPYDREFKDFALINAVLPRVYYPALQGNIYERLARDIASQLIGDDIELDYDQFLAKKPRRPGAQFAWHQDQGYWPVGTPDTRTATCSLAIDDSLRANGCLRFIPGSHKAQELRPHRPAIVKKGEKGDREEAHTLVVDIGEDEDVEYVEVKRGSITVHDEWVVHGSSGNPSDNWRRTYVVAFRSEATVAHERSIGFTHSHNDKVNWETLLGKLET